MALNLSALFKKDTTTNTNSGLNLSALSTPETQKQTTSKINTTALIDPALKTRLREQGQIAKIKELEESAKQAQPSWLTTVGSKLFTEKREIPIKKTILTALLPQPFKPAAQFIKMKEPELRGGLLGELVRFTGGYPARFISSAAMELAERKTGIKTEYTPKTEEEKTMFGEEPIKALTAQGGESFLVAPAIKAILKKIKPEMTEEEARLYALVPALMTGSLVENPFFMPEKAGLKSLQNTIKNIAKVSEEKVIINELKNFFKMSDEQLIPLAKKLTGINDEKLVANELQGFAKFLQGDVKVADQVFVLPPDVRVYDEAKAIGAKRIAPDRITHQQLNPELGIQKLVEKENLKYTRNFESAMKQAEELDRLIKTYGNNFPARTKGNIEKYPTLLKDWEIYNNASAYGAGMVKDLPGLKNTALRRAEYWNWNKVDQNKILEGVKKDYVAKIKDDISKGYKYPEAVLNYDKSFKTAVDSRARYEKGLFTSFSADDQRIVFDDQKRITAGMKRQDGKELLPEQKQEIIDGVLQTQKALGIDLNKLSQNERWVFAHLNGKNPFLTNAAAGLYRRGDGFASISLGGIETFEAIEDGVKIKKTVNTTAAHELGHALDANQSYKLLPNATLFELRRNYNPVEFGFRGDKYWRSEKEVTARAIEQYVAVKEGQTAIFDRQGYWKKDIFERDIAPAIENAINEKFGQYKTKEILQEAKKPLTEIFSTERKDINDGLSGLTQKEKVAAVIQNQPKSIKQIAEETKIKEPNIRRILGVGAKEGTFERVDAGVYKLVKGDKELAYIETGNALEVLPRLVQNGFKADMVFLDIPYNAAGNRGGNRMNESNETLFKTISPEQFGKFMESVTQSLRNEDSPVVYMFSQSKTSAKETQRYTDKIIEAGYKPLAKGDYYKMTKDGKRFTKPMRKEPLDPEGIIIFNRTGKFDFNGLKNELPDLQYKLVRPKGWQTEKPAELLESLIKMTTKEGEVVLDPFAGSGVTGAEAIKAGRQTTAIEISPKAVEDYIKPRFAEASKSVEEKEAVEAIKELTEEPKPIKSAEELAYEQEEMAKIKRELNAEPFFSKASVEDQYDEFKKILRNPKINNPKARESILNGDIDTLKKEGVRLGVFKDKTEVDNLLYSQEMSGNELLDKFKERLLQDQPELLMSKTEAKNLGYFKPEPEFVKEVKKEVKENKIIKEKVILRDKTKTVKDNFKPLVEQPEEDLITTRKMKQTEEWRNFARYAEENLQDKDITPAITFRHASMTMERVAEFLDGGIGGRTYQTMVKPVYDAAKKMTLEGSKTKQEVDAFKVLEGSKLDQLATYFAQGKISDAPAEAKKLANYIRARYDDYIERLNAVRVKIGVEPFKKRKDYVTHINELNTLSELFGSIERVTVQSHISKLKSELLDLHPDWTDERAFQSAKRQVEGLTGVAQYVDARQPAFKFAKQRLTEYEADPSILRSFNAYMPSALRYIYQGENVARNKAFKDVLPAQAREFARLWNTEQVAGRGAPSFLSPAAKRAVSAIRSTLGANTILGNMATTLMQLTSWPQVMALAGVKNTFVGIGRRLYSFIPGKTSVFANSRTNILRSMEMDIGLGDSLIDSLLIKIGKKNINLADPSARTRQVINVGRDFLTAIMKAADQFTVGATYEAFYRKGILDGLNPEKAMEYAEIMTGKTQANYFKEALPPLLNTIEGKTFAQFGTYGMNQWEMFKRDFGKEFKLDEKNSKSVKEFFKQFLVYMTAAYIIDSMSEDTFGRQPFNVKELVDDSVGFVQGKKSGTQLRTAITDTVANYLPFMGSVKYGSMPPVFEFGNDVTKAIFASGEDQENALSNLQEKWVYNILLPYGGNQVRKTMQGVDAINEVDLPFVKNTSKNIDIKTNIDKAKAILFGSYATGAAQDYFEGQEDREAIKEKYDITGSISSPENIEKLKKMSPDEFKLYTAGYASSTKKMIDKKINTKNNEKTTTKKPLGEILGGSKENRKSLSSIFGT